MKVTTPSDRVQLIDRGSLREPGCCALCGSGNCDDGYVDCGIWVEFLGNVYFCWNCATQIASVIGCLSADEHQHLRELLEVTVKERNAAKEELDAANERLNDYDNLMLRALASNDYEPISVSSDAATPEPAESAGADEPVNESPKSADEGEPVVKKSVASGGRRKPPRTQRSDSSTSNGISI